MSDNTDACEFCKRTGDVAEGWVSIPLGSADWLTHSTKRLCPTCAKFARAALLGDATAKDVLEEDDPDYETATDW